MNRRHSLAAAAITAALLIIPAAAVADSPPLVYTCQAQPCTANQEFTVSDPHGAPIFSVGEYGGAAVYGDQISVYKPGDVYHPVVQLRDDGTILIGGQVLTGRDVAFLHCIEKRRLAWCRTAVGP